MNIPLALNYSRPNEEWTLNGDDYESLTWLSQTPKPTKKELESAYPLAQAAEAAAEAAAVQARVDAIAHAKTIGFTEAMLAVMYPTLTP